jgi:hypothetical protein
MSVTGQSYYSAHKKALSSQASELSIQSVSNGGAKEKEKQLRLATNRRRLQMEAKKKQDEERERERREKALSERRDFLGSGVPAKRRLSPRQASVDQSDDISVGNTTITTAASDRYIRRRAPQPNYQPTVPLPAEQPQLEPQQQPLNVNVCLPSPIPEGPATNASMEEDSLCGSPMPEAGLDESGFDRVQADVEELRDMRRRMREGEDAESVVPSVASKTMMQKKPRATSVSSRVRAYSSNNPSSPPQQPPSSSSSLAAKNAAAAAGYKHRHDVLTGASPPSSLPPPPPLSSGGSVKHDKKFGIGHVSAEEAERRELLARQKEFAKKMKERNAEAFRAKQEARRKREEEQRREQAELIEQQNRELAMQQAQQHQYDQHMYPPPPRMMQPSESGDDLFSTINMKVGAKGSGGGFKTGMTMGEDALMRSLARLDFRLEEKKVVLETYSLAPSNKGRRKKPGPKQAKNRQPERVVARLPAEQPQQHVYYNAPPPAPSQTRAPLIDLSQQPVFEPAKAVGGGGGGQVYVGHAYDALVTPARRK